jgi:cell division control protein 6
MFNQSASESQLFRSETALTTGHTPDQPAGRETKAARIADAVRPLTRRQPPENLLIYGPAGVGKTTFVNHVLDNLATETRVTTAAINCWRYNTRSALLTELLIQLGYPAPRKGRPVDTLLATLQEWLDKHQGAAVVLDEFDRLDHQTEIAYDLQQTADEADNDLGLLLISNQPPTSLQLAPRSQSRLTYQTLAFPPYTAEELVAILDQRAEQAFRRDTVADEALKLIAATVAEQDGDCRHALDLLRRAGRQAEHEEAEELTAAHVKQLLGPGSNSTDT